MASDDNDLLIFAAAGLLGYYLYSKSRDASLTEQSFLVPRPLSSAEDSGLTIAHYMEPPDATDMIAPAAGKIAEIVAKLAPIPVVGQLAQVIGASVFVEAQALTEIISEGNLSTGNILTTAALFFPPTWIFLGIGKLLHIDLFGHDLDDVNHVLLNAFNSPTTQDNVQFGKPIYFLDGDKVLHEIVDTSMLNKAGFSWRAVIAVPQAVIDFYPIGVPLKNVADEQTPPPPGVTPTPMTYMERPRSSADIRAYFGCNSIFKVGNDQQLYGPWPGMSGPARDCSSRAETKPLPGSPAEMLQGLAAAAAGIRAARF